MFNDTYKEIKNPTTGLYKEKGSRFISYLFPVYSEEQVKEKQMSMGYADDGDDNVDITLKVVGIRPGEKLHEELISKEEWLRTTDHENYLIGTESTTEELWSYNSKDSLMDTSETYKFLQDSGVIQ